MVVFCYHFEPPFLTWSTIRPDGTGDPPAPVTGVDRPVMIHDMAVTERYVVLVVAPLYFDLAAAMSGGSVLAWRPEDGTRIALVPRDGGPVRWFHDEAFWVWHTANAHEENGTVVLDYAEWPHPAGLTPAPFVRRTSPARTSTRPRAPCAVRSWTRSTSTSRASTTGSSAGRRRSAPTRCAPGARSRTRAVGTGWPGTTRAPTP